MLLIRSMTSKAAVTSRYSCRCIDIKGLKHSRTVARQFSTHSWHSFAALTANRFHMFDARLVNPSSFSEKSHGNNSKKDISNNGHQDNNDGDSGQLQPSLTPAEQENITSDESLHVQKMLFEGIKEKAEKSSRIINNNYNGADTSKHPSTNDVTITTNAATVVEDEFHKLDLRVALVLAAHRHAEADTLYIEQVDVGDPEEMAKGGRVIVSGLVPYMSALALEGRKVIVVKNMKPAKLRGVISQGMLLCAEQDGRVELLEPPQNSKPGIESLFNTMIKVIHIYIHTCIHTYQLLMIYLFYYLGRPESVLNPKKKVWERIAPHLTTDECGVA
ncbi:hypothetical protein BDF19DRAFT_429552, partial [Syncephalis fuscata]